MTVVTRCKGCGIELEAEDEDGLVLAVREHLAAAHPGGHEPTLEQVRAVIRSRRDDGHS